MLLLLLVQGRERKRERRRKFFDDEEWRAPDRPPMRRGINRRLAEENEGKMEKGVYRKRVYLRLDFM